MSSLSLPQTLAALRRGDKLSTVEANATGVVATEIAAALRSELPVAAIPMENYLERGGWPEFVGIDVRGTRDQGKQTELLLTLRFIEHTPASCPSSSKPEVRIAYIKAIIDKGSSLAELVDDA